LRTFQEYRAYQSLNTKHVQETSFAFLTTQSTEKLAFKLYRSSKKRFERTGPQAQPCKAVLSTWTKPAHTMRTTLPIGPNEAGVKFIFSLRMEADPVPETLCLTLDNRQVRRNGGIQLVHTSYTTTNDTSFHNKDILPNLPHDMQISV